MRTVPATPRTQRAAQHSPAMEQHLEQQQQQAEQQEQRDWASLPADVLQICLSSPPLLDDEASSQAAFATCKAFARALVHSSLQGFHWNVGCSLVPSAQLLEALWGSGQRKDQGARKLLLYGAINSTPGRCVAELLGASVRLPFITNLELKGMSLDVLLPSGVGVLLPNLATVLINQCELTPEARTTVLDATCSRLQEVHIRRLSAGDPGAATAVATAQLKQLAKLPSLSSIVLHDSSCPTLFLLALGTQLTNLHLDHSYLQYLPNTRTPAPGWKATLQHVARCTRLRELTIPCATAEELGLVAPALQQLRKLCLNSSASIFMASMGADGDAMLEVMLGLPHLTTLGWHGCGACFFQPRYTDSQQHPCRWEELTMDIASVVSLARLPLHSLKQPVTWHDIIVRPHTSRQEVRAAVANVTRGCPPGFTWAHGVDALPSLQFVGLSTLKTIEGVLVGLQPLLVPLACLSVGGVPWDAELAKVLGQVLPRTCTCLELSGGNMSREVLEQVAISMRWLATLQLVDMHVSPQDVVQYVRTVRSSTKGEGAVAQPALGAIKVILKVKVIKPKRSDGTSEVRHRQAWQEAVREVEHVGEGAVSMLVQLA